VCVCLRAQASEASAYTPPYRIVIDKASYHVASRPSRIDPPALVKDNLLRLCTLYDVTHEELGSLDKKNKKNPASGVVGASIKKNSLAKYLSGKMGSQRNRLEILLWMRTKHLPRAEEWCMEYEVWKFWMPCRLCQQCPLIISVLS